MEYSKHNIFSRVRGREQWFLVNLLSGQADLLDKDVADVIASGSPPPTAFADAFTEKGYWVEPAEEQRRYDEARARFTSAAAKEEIQLFFLLSYACNFTCDYCYQSGYDPEKAVDRAAATDAFFRYVDTHFRGRRKYVTLFGGEPLLPGNHEHVADIIAKLNARALGLAIVTNGYTLLDYLPLLKTAAVREVQVTLDGPPALHDKRRPLGGGLPTFDRIALGIDALLAAGIPVNLRTVLDRENIAGLPELARIAKARGWTGHPKFKTAFGRNYELHYCQGNAGRLFDRLSMWEAVVELGKEHPEVLAYHRPALSVSRYLFENGALPTGLFDSCPATKSEWAFDYTGRIYSCTATVGKEGEELGRFWPVETPLSEAAAEWSSRDVTTIPQCTTCALQLACGGGCGAVAKNRTGSILTPDCRTPRELMELGFDLYQTEQEPESIHA